MTSTQQNGTFPGHQVVSTGSSPMYWNGRPSIPNSATDRASGDSDSETNDRRQKRQRISKACDTCRTKKIKCDGKLPKCSYCEGHQTECLFTHNNKKRQPPKSAKYVEALEAKIAHMESLLASAGLLEQSKVEHALPTPRPTIVTQTPSHARPYLPNSVSAHRQREPDSGGVDSLADEMCTLVTTNLGETKYIGSSSSLTILSPRGTQWIKDKTGDDGFQKLISEAAMRHFTWFHWKPEIFGDLFIRRTYQSLPTKEEALSLLRLYFEHCNCMFPLFHEPTFMHLVEKEYSHEPFTGSGWWACLNVALAISHRMRAHRESHTGAEDGRKAWLYMKNALAVLSELTLRNNDLLSVQAVTGMALFLQGTPNPFLAFYFVGAAIRLAQGLGLHKHSGAFSLNQVELEQRKRVFWILYMLDKDISLRSGRPAAQDDDDMNIGLPSQDPMDQVGTIPIGTSSQRVNLFRKLCEFAQIQARVYKLLYADRASRLPDGEILATIGQLDKELEDWKDSLPLQIRPENDIQIAMPFLFSIAVLHFAYYNCLTTIHRMSIHHDSWTARQTDPAHHNLQNPRVYMSAALCVNAARTSIAMIAKLPPLQNGYTWIVMYYPVSALVQLFSNILQNPQDPRGESDLELMRSVITWLSTISDEDSDEYVKRMKLICSEFERVSRIAFEKAKHRNQWSPTIGSDPDVIQGPGLSHSSTHDNATTVSFKHSQWSPQQRPMPLTQPMDYGLPNSSLDTNNGYVADEFHHPFVPLPMTLEWDWAELWPQGFDFAQFNGSGGL